MMRTALRALLALALLLPVAAEAQQKLSTAAPTTSTQLRSVITDPTGTGSLVFRDDPTFLTKITTPRVLLNANGSTANPPLGWGTSGWSADSAGNILFSLNGARYGTMSLDTGAGSGAAAGGLVAWGKDACKSAPVTGTDTANTCLGAYALGNILGYTTVLPFYGNAAIGDAACQVFYEGTHVGCFGSGSGINFLRGGSMHFDGRGAGAGLVEGSYGLYAGHGSGFFDVVGIGNSYGGGDLAGSPNGGLTTPYATVQASAVAGVMTVSQVYAGILYRDQTCVSDSNVAFSPNRKISTFGTGAGGTGTYNMSGAITFTSQIVRCGFGGNYKTAWGYNAGTWGPDDSNTLHLGANARSTGSNLAVIGSGLTSVTLSGTMASGMTLAAITGANATWTAAQMHGGQIAHSTQAATGATTATAANIVASIPGAEAGSFYWLTVGNSNSGTLTLTGGSGVSISGPTTILSSQTALLKVYVFVATAGAEQVIVYNLPFTGGYAPTASPSFTGTVDMTTTTPVRWVDAGVSRVGTAIVGIGNGTAGDVSGTLRAALGTFGSGASSGSLLTAGSIPGSTNQSTAAFFGPRGNPANTGSAAEGILRVGYTGGLYTLDMGVTSTPSTAAAWLQARSNLAYGTFYDVWLNPNGGAVSIGYTSTQTALLAVNGTGAFAGALSSAGAVTSSSATGGVGYATGAGSTVTQATSKSTTVGTINKSTLKITMNNAALANATTVSFVWTSSAIAATDQVMCNHESAGTLGAYVISTTPAAGSVTINVRNVHTGSLSEAIVLRCSVLKSVDAHNDNGKLDRWLEPAAIERRAA